MRFRRSTSPALMLTATLLLTIAAADLVARGATIKLPDGFAERSTRIEFTGFGGFNRGSFRGADYRGDFVRTETRWGIFDPLYVLNRGRSSFTLEDAGGTVNIEASCRVTRDVLTYRIVTVDVDKMSYECHYSGPDASGARFALGEPKREGFRERLAARERRIGEAFVLEQQFVIESVHNYEGTRLTSQKPLGYMIESDGIVVAAVDMLDWNPIVHLRDDGSEAEKHAALVVALSLAVLRDPANSALEDIADLDDF